MILEFNKATVRFYDIHDDRWDDKLEKRVKLKNKVKKLQKTITFDFYCVGELHRKLREIALNEFGYIDQKMEVSFECNGTF
jgi:hypothetical protein|tara:strand:+ start:197 stop:439 length:243 start_codon:yes stop_codon:yes gene_type:complete